MKLETRNNDSISFNRTIFYLQLVENEFIKKGFSDFTDKLYIYKR